METHARRMARRKGGWLAVWLVAALALAVWTFQVRAATGGEPRAGGAVTLEPQERLVTILQTNDIHGGVELATLYDGSQGGGFALWSGTVNAIRRGLSARFGDRAGVLVLDGGDQFQGTLLSNFNEGRLVFDLMNRVGYDAVVPGNHDYDFGPRGWLDDKVNPGNPDKNPFSVIEDLAARADFPLLSANAYFRDSLVDSRGRAVENPEEDPSRVDFRRARRPEFLEPYRLVTVAGVRVAMIGLDHHRTPLMTTIENVSSLYFRDEAATYHEIRTDLEGKADLFVLIMHNGNTSRESGASDVVRSILDRSGDRSDWLHAVVAGHTHYVNDDRVAGIPIVQSGANGERFGRIDLVWSAERGEVVGAKMRTYAGSDMFEDRCDDVIADFCSVSPASLEQNARVRLEGMPLEADSGSLELIASERAELAPVAERVLGEADGEIWRNRVIESPLSNAMTDALRRLSGADFAFLNTGGLRAPLEAGEVTYAELFRVLPFSNRAVTLAPVPFSRVLELVRRAIKSCGAYSVLMASGLRVLFEQDCENRGSGGVDVDAVLYRIESADGELLYERQEGGSLVPEDRRFEVATVDFLAAGGSGYSDFIGLAQVADHGILREAMTRSFLDEPAVFRSERDGRWVAVPPQGGVSRLAVRAANWLRVFPLRW